MRAKIVSTRLSPGEAGFHWFDDRAPGVKRKPKLRRRALQLIEAAAAYFVFRGVLGVMPVAAASALGGFFARWIGPHLPVSRVATRNLSAAFPEKSEVEIAAIVKRMWDNLGRTTAEYPHLDALWDKETLERFQSLDPAEMERRTDPTPIVISGPKIEIVGAENFVRAVHHDGPRIIFTAHMGNWEILPLNSRLSGVPVAALYREPNNPHIARLIRRMRSGSGVFLPRGGIGYSGAISSAKVLDDNGCLGLLVDQKVISGGLIVPFFGRPVAMISSPARLALRYDCPLYGAWTQRLPGGRFRINVTPPLEIPTEGDHDARVRRILEMINDLLESWIRAQPDQWLWLHDRWRIAHALQSQLQEAQIIYTATE